MNRLFSGRSDMPFALLLLAPSLLLLGGLVAWPMVSNIEISFLRLPLNPNIESMFVGVSNYVRILSDPGFWHSLWMTVWYTALVVAGSTVLGLAVAMFFNREFRLRKTARSLVILSYVTPSISLVFAWKYMFNNGYGIVNYLGVDLLHLYEQAPLWFDNPALPEQWQQLSFPLFWQGCELQVTLDAQRIAIRTSAPVSLRLNGQLITVAEESVFCLGDFILPFNGTATKHQEDE
ncbi:hypothetical protein FOE36_02815 [Escherichia coli]|nr:hypothetical protein [Escherichia coli]